MSGSVSVPAGHVGTISFTVSGAVASAVAQVFATEIANLANAGQLFVAEFPTNSIDVTAGNTGAAANQNIGITFPDSTTLNVTASIAAGASAADAATSILNALNAAEGAGFAQFAPGSTTTILLAEGTMTSNTGPATLATDLETTVPTPPAGQAELIVVNDTTTGTVTLTLPPGNVDFVLNTSSANLIINASDDPSVVSTGVGSTTMFGGAQGGSDVASFGNNLFQSLGTGGGQYFISFGGGNDTVWATSGNDVIAAGGGANLIGLGSGNNFVSSTGADTILAGSGNNSVLAGQGSNDLIFGSTGSLLFVGGGINTAATIVGVSGNQTLFGGAGGGSGLFFVGQQSFILDAQGASDTVVAGAGSATAALFAENGGSVTLFSPQANNALVAGPGNVTLNAGGGTGGNSLWANTGADSLVGGSGSDVFAFVNGAAGGVDTIGNWTDKDTLALLGYGPNGIVAQGTDAFGNAVITLSDNTRITIQGVSSIPSSHIFLS